FGFADALVGDKFQEFVVRGRRVPGWLIDRRADRAWGDAVNPNAMPGDLLSNALHHHVDAALRRGVIDVPRPWDDLVHGTHADDFPGSAGDVLANSAANEFADRFSA